MDKKTLLLSVFMLGACDQRSPDKGVHSSKLESAGFINNRWYSQTDLDLGATTYQTYCSQCHNKNAAGTLSWKQTLADGNYPPPPLNGTAHACHHDMGTLTRTIKNGEIVLGGVMPGFDSKLSDTQIRAVIAYFQSF